MERFRADESVGSLPHWTLCGNLLAGQRSPVFGAHLLGGIRYQIDLLVVDLTPLDAEYHFGGRGGSSGGRIGVPAGHPPTALYELSLTATPDATVVATGKTPVFARRKLSHARSLPVGPRSYSSTGRMQAKAHWLGAMLNTDLAAVHANLERTAELRWSDAATLRTDWERLRGEIATAHERLRALCRAAGWIGDEATAPPLPLRLRVQDLRSDKSTPLPAIE
ncbi:MAG: hypothetical protein U1E73_10590 [Planctomycetota bacterium]